MGISRAIGRAIPNLTRAFTGEDDSLHPLWVTIDLANASPINAIRIAWAEPHARRYLVQYWTGDDPSRRPTKGAWLPSRAAASTGAGVAR